MLIDPYQGGSVGNGAGQLPNGYCNVESIHIQLMYT